ncbi:DUF6797 domain-containing protein [Fodinibius roseus]|nr:DUF6797 domain-containing protein [Fodinibius roseus]
MKSGETESDQNNQAGSYEVMDYGPVISESIRKAWPEGSIVRKGLAIRLDHGAAFIFDTDLVGMAAAAAGGWLDISKTDYTSYKGSDIAAVEGRQVFGSPEIAGWAQDGTFNAPRASGLGSIPRDWAHYKGYYRNGDKIVLSYRVGGTDILEYPEAIKEDGKLVFARNINIPETEHSLQALLLEKRDGWSLIQDGTREIGLSTGDGALVVRLAGTSGHARLHYEEGRVELHIPPQEEPATTRVLIYEASDYTNRFRDLPAELADITDPEPLTHGGPARWEQELVVSGNKGQGAFAYAVDQIPVPFDNPWGSWMRLSGIDFFEDGKRAAISTWNGDVWVVSGIDNELEEVSWRRYASGLFYPMGLAVVDGKIYVNERSQLTRLHDLNSDGEADYYENFNNDRLVYPRAHSLELQVDSEGYFYFFKNGNRVPGEVPGHGALMRVSPDGSERQQYASGLRGANTLGIGPDKTILSADQQGNWVPVERIDLIKPNSFYGFRPHGGTGRPVGSFEPPVAWIPYDVNNSSGSLTYTDEDRWGPLSGRWVLGSYGQADLQVVLTQELAEGKMQGATVKLPVESKSGLIRGTVNPADGQLYLVGLRGWTTLGKADGSFERIRYTGGKVYLPTDFRITPRGVELTFSEPLDPGSAENRQNYHLQRWEYIYSQQYGSPEISLRNPEAEGRDSVTVQSAKLSEDGRSVFLEIPDMRSVMQMKVEYDLAFEDGKSASNALYPTVNWLSKEEADKRPEWQQRMIARHRQKASDKEEIVEEESGQQFISEKFQQGKEIFQQNCASCHVRGGAAPSLDESEWAGSSPEAVVRILLHGKRGNRGIMTPFEWMDNEQIASVVSFIRQNWHEKEPITSAQVEEIRRDTRNREELWTEEELKNLE